MRNSGCAATADQAIALDLLRGFSAVAVFVCHVRNESFVAYHNLPASQHSFWITLLFAGSRLANEAVMVFFALSGYLVCGAVLRRCKEGCFCLRDYAMDRATRIFLPLVPACLISAVLQLFLFHLPVSGTQLALNLLGLNDVFACTLHLDAPLWTLAYEIWFYVVAGALAYLWCRYGRKNPWWLAVAAAIAVFGMFVAARYLLLWAAAGAFALVPDDRRTRALAIWGVSIAIGGTMLFEIQAQAPHAVSALWKPGFLSAALICLGTAMTLPFLSGPQTSKCLSRVARPSKGLSRVSYSLYLFHFPANMCLNILFPTFAVISWASVALFSARLAICLLAVMIAYALFEAHTIRLKGLLRFRLLPESQQVRPA